MRAAKAAAKAPEEPAAPRVRTKFDSDGRIIVEGQMEEVRREKRPKLAIQPIENYDMLKFLPWGLKFTTIQLKRTSNMTRGGKKPSMSALVVVGNEAGAAGYAFGSAAEAKEAVDKAVLRAYRTMIPVSLLDGHTIHEKAMGKCRSTRVFARPGPREKGLVCHKYIAAVCKLAGIKDIGADVIGRKNPLSIVRAFFQILESQRSILEKAAEQNKTVLEYRHPAHPPAIIHRAVVAPEEQAKVEAQRATLGWLRAFPRPATFTNFMLARQLLTAGPAAAPSGGAADIAQWLKQMPARVVLDGTALEGCSLPAHVTKL